MSVGVAILFAPSLTTRFPIEQMVRECITRVATKEHSEGLRDQSRMKGLQNKEAMLQMTDTTTCKEKQFNAQ
ncbi:ATP-synt_DE_N domain-containing protein [Psidium guajava]|nr:ATP-synt_DE_N domain-containing protein [Psidium guajava]